MESLLLEIFRNDGDVALGNMVSRHSGGGLGSVLVLLEVFSSLHDSIIL